MNLHFTGHFKRCTGIDRKNKIIGKFHFQIAFCTVFEIFENIERIKGFSVMVEHGLIIPG